MRPMAAHSDAPTPGSPHLQAAAATTRRAREVVVVIVVGRDGVGTRGTVAVRAGRGRAVTVRGRVRVRVVGVAVVVAGHFPVLVVARQLLLLILVVATVGIGVGSRTGETPAQPLPSPVLGFAQGQSNMTRFGWQATSENVLELETKSAQGPGRVTRNRATLAKRKLLRFGWGKEHA